MYIMLKELETPFKINKFIYATDLFILVGFAGLGAVLQGLVFSKLCRDLYFQNCKRCSLSSIC